MTRWTADDIPDLTGRIAIVTGANGGLGVHTALELARHGARVVLAVRNQERGAQAAQLIRDKVPNADLEQASLDVSSLLSVRRFAEAFSGQHERLDLLVNNAGVMAIPRQLSADGYELQFATNHLGHFALGGLLLSHLLAADEPRVVAVSSQAHRTGRISFDDLNGERRYMRWLAYSQSKLADLMYALELDRRAKKAGLPLVGAAAHPGYAATGLQHTSAGKSRLMSLFYDLGNRLVAQSAEMGALPVLYAATAPDVVGGEYFGPDGAFGMRGHPTREKPARQALDEDTARRLWEASEKLTGVTYDALGS